MNGNITSHAKRKENKIYNMEGNQFNGNKPEGNIIKLYKDIEMVIINMLHTFEKEREK